jgi:hypothetical protein
LCSTYLENGIERISESDLSDNNRGGINSPSVRRMVGPNVSKDIRTQQLIWNLQSQTATALRVLRGAKSLTREEWQSIIAPTLVIVGEEVLARSVSDSRIKYVPLLMERKFEDG